MARAETHAFRTAGEIVTGCGAIREIGRIAAGLGVRAVFVTGRGSLRRSGKLDWITEILDGAGVAVTLYEGVEEDPTVATVDAIREVVAKADARFLIGIGGGSAMDAAKAAAGLAAESDPTAVFLASQRAARPGLAVLAVPTTSGTGAEVTPNAVITDPAARTKLSLRHGHYMPAAAIVDPELTFSAPPRVTAASGMDALTQAIESYVSIHATPLTDALAFEAFRLLWPNVERAYARGDDVEARTACAYGSLLAGMALASARLGAVHGMAHPIGVRCGIPHGLICAALLPEVVRMNAPYSAAKFARLSQAAGIVTSGDDARGHLRGDDARVAHPDPCSGIGEVPCRGDACVAHPDLASAIDALNDRMGIYSEFSKCRIAPEAFGPIADDSMPSGSLKANPRAFTREDVLAVLAAVTGKRGGSIGTI